MQKLKDKIKNNTQSCVVEILKTVLKLLQHMTTVNVEIMIANTTIKSTTVKKLTVKKKKEILHPSDLCKVTKKRKKMKKQLMH